MSNSQAMYTHGNRRKQVDSSFEKKVTATNNSDSSFKHEKGSTFDMFGLRGQPNSQEDQSNIHTVQKGVHALATYLFRASVNVRDRGVVVAYDSESMSRELALQSAKGLGAQGIKAYVFADVQPKTLLSFAIRYVGAVAGIWISIDCEYGYRFHIYNEDGGQMIPEEAHALSAFIEDDIEVDQVPQPDLEQLMKSDLFQWVYEDIEQAYLEQLQHISKLDEHAFREQKNLQITYIPSHETTRYLVVQGLKQFNFTHVKVVNRHVPFAREFPLIAPTNGEDQLRFNPVSNCYQDADILLATDREAERLEVAIRSTTGEYIVLTSHQLGALLVDYLLAHSDLTVFKNPRLLQTVATTHLGRKIAHSYGVKTIDTLTEFKYIGEKIRQFDETGETFVFGFEECYGYLVGSFTRDRDAIQAAAITCEMAHYWRQQGKTLLDVLEMLYEKHGYYAEGTLSFTSDDADGNVSIDHLMDNLRYNQFSEVAGSRIRMVEDYALSQRTFLEHDQTETIHLPKENIIKYELEQHGWICVKPSPTNTELICYFGVDGMDREETNKRLTMLKKDIEKHMQHVFTQ
ncbi:MAG TPA: phospho-sugar mutase [Bacillota bacterium]|nr:phospho-sugar mutase [Bacillota bacterium]